MKDEMVLTNRNIPRREALRNILFATGGLLLASQTATSATIIDSQLSEIEIAKKILEKQKNFFARMFDFRNRFWRGLGAIALNLGKRALGLDGISFGSSGYNQDARLIQDYAQNQQANGWYTPPGSEIYRLPQNGLSCGFANQSSFNFKDIQSNNGSIVSMNPATLIGLTEAADNIRCSCANFSKSELADLVIPQSVNWESNQPQRLNGNYKGEFYSKKGLIQVTQNRSYSPNEPNLANLIVEIRDRWKPTNIIWQPSNPMTVNYGE